MLIYFDESYDNPHEYLLLGALFNPHSRYLHKEIGKVKSDCGFFDRHGKPKEMKYTNCRDAFNYEVCRRSINCFIKSTSWFRCVVIKQDLLDLDYFGKFNEPTKIKKARAYKKFAEMLIGNNLKNTTNGVLLVDDLTRCDGDEFIYVMKQEFCTPEQNYSAGSSLPVLREILPATSDREQYQVLQVCDLLLGCVLNSLKPTSNPYKNKIRQYLTRRLEVPSLLPSFWGNFTKRYVEQYYPKFNVWYWKPKIGKTRVR